MRRCERFCDERGDCIDCYWDDECYYTGKTHAEMYGGDRMSRYLTREQILSAQDLPVEEVEVPEWGGIVRVRGLTGAERDAFEQSIAKRKGRNVEVNLRNVRAKLVALSVVDEHGKRVFSDADVEALGQKSAAALDRVFRVAQRLSGLTNEDVEELAGNSLTGLSDASTSD